MFSQLRFSIHLATKALGHFHYLSVVKRSCTFKNIARFLNCVSSIWELSFKTSKWAWQYFRCRFAFVSSTWWYVLLFRVEKKIIAELVFFIFVKVWLIIDLRTSFSSSVFRRNLQGFNLNTLTHFFPQNFNLFRRSTPKCSTQQLVKCSVKVLIVFF